MVPAPAPIIRMIEESEAFAEYFFNAAGLAKPGGVFSELLFQTCAGSVRVSESAKDIIMRHLLSENYVESELQGSKKAHQAHMSDHSVSQNCNWDKWGFRKKRPPGAGVDYAELLVGRRVFASLKASADAIAKCHNLFFSMSSMSLHVPRVSTSFYQ